MIWARSVRSRVRWVYIVAKLAIVEGEVSLVDVDVLVIGDCRESCPREKAKD